MPKIVFFNHYHRGDLHTSKEFVRQVMNEVRGYEFEYYHNNPHKLLSDLKIPTTGSPDFLDKTKPILKKGDAIYVNTWVGSQWDVFCKHGGINMNTLYEQWYKLFNAINKLTGSSLQLHNNKESYLPFMDFSDLNLAGIDRYLKSSKDKKRILICNNIPNSSQSFQASMDEFILPAVLENPQIDFICTNKVAGSSDNLLYTDDIIQSNDDCDLQEISYLSNYCNVIIGKNSGPFVFCETYYNYMNSEKSFYSFNTKHPDYDVVMETMSNGLQLGCSYRAIPIYDIISLSKEDRLNINNVMSEAVSKCKN